MGGLIMFITKRKYESDIRCAELRGQRIAKERYEMGMRMRELNENMYRSIDDINRHVFRLENRIHDIENCFGLNDDKTNKTK